MGKSKHRASKNGMRHGKSAGERARARRKENKWVLLFCSVFAALVVAFVAVIILTNRDNPSKNMRVALAEDGSLHVARAELRNGFNFVDWGGEEELILYPNGSGEVMAAFDTCEECYQEGDVHFRARDESMICSVCSTTNPLSDFGEQEWGECRPVSVPTAARLDTDSEIVISAEALRYAGDMLTQWDTGDMSMTFADFEA